jgi:hypothetical protein
MHILLLIAALHGHGHHYGWTQPHNPHHVVVQLPPSTDPPPHIINWTHRVPAFPGS